MEKAELMDIIQKSKDGDMEAMEKLLLHAHTSVSYQCRKMLKNEQDAEDMTQEILVTVYQKLDSLNEPAAFNQWLKKITATRCINVLTRTHTELQFAEDEEGNSILNTLEEMDEKKIPDKWLDNKETTRMIEEIINGLPDVQRLCTLMFYYSEMSVREIAHSLKVSENTIKSRLNYARKAIKEKVLDYEKKGVKLYGISPLPFLFYFLHKREKEEKDPAAARIMVDKILAQSAFSVAGAVNAVTSAVTGTTNTAAGSAASVSAPSSAIAAFLGTLSPRIIAGVAAALVFVAGTTVAVTLGNKDEPAPTVLTQEQGSSSDDHDILMEAPESTGEEETKAEDNGASSGNPSDSSTGSSSDEESTSQTEPAVSPLEVHTHTYFAEYTVPPSCREEGYTFYRCSVCTSATYISDFTGVLPHNYVKTVVPPTAYSQGYTLYECTAFVTDGVRCHSYTSDYTEKLPAGSDTSGCVHSFVRHDSGDVDFYHSATVEYICAHCGFSYTEFIPAAEHDHEWVLQYTAQPTCSQEGFDQYVCYHCGVGGINPLEKRENIVPALGHDFTTTIVAPTETALGYTLFECNRCNIVFQDNYTELTDGSTSVHTHSYTSEGTPTCSNSEPIKYTCICGHYYFQEVIVPHAMDSRVVEPTSSEPGYTEYWCTVCGYTYRRAVTDLQEDGSVVAHIHNYNIPFEIPATCEDPGRTGRECICGERILDETVIPSLGHDLVVTIPPMSEENTGLRSCTRCDYTVVVAGKPHNYIVTVIEPTETAQGYTEYTCSRCGDTYRDDFTDYVPADPAAHTHSYAQTQTPATCTDGGYTTYTCDCGDSYTADETEALGHSYTSAVTDPTETEQGYTEHTCSVCGDTYRDSFTDPVLASTDPEDLHSHSYTSTVTSPTCTAGGYTTYLCSCGDQYVADETAAAGHSYTSSVVDPTETEQGYTEYTCSACADSYRDTYTDPIPSE